MKQILSLDDIKKLRSIPELKLREVENVTQGKIRCAALNAWELGQRNLSMEKTFLLLTEFSEIAIWEQSSALWKHILTCRNKLMTIIKDHPLMDYRELTLPARGRHN